MVLHVNQRMMLRVHICVLLNNSLALNRLPVCASSWARSSEQEVYKVIEQMSNNCLQAYNSHFVLYSYGKLRKVRTDYETAV